MSNPAEPITGYAYGNQEVPQSAVSCRLLEQRHHRRNPAPRQALTREGKRSNYASMQAIEELNRP